MTWSLEHLVPHECQPLSCSSPSPNGPPDLEAEAAQDAIPSCVALKRIQHGKDLLASVEASEIKGYSRGGGDAPEGKVSMASSRFSDGLPSIIHPTG